MTRPQVTACVNGILAHVFSGRGLTIYDDDVAMDMSPAFALYARRYLVPFLREELALRDHIGLFVWGARPVEHGLGPYSLAPFVPKAGTYTIVTRVEHGVQQFHFYWSSGGARVRDTRMFVESGFGHDPTCDGKLRSRASTLVDVFAFVDSLMANKTTADYERAAPTLTVGYNFEADQLPPPSYRPSDATGASREAYIQRDRRDLPKLLADFQRRTGLSAHNAFDAVYTASMYTPRDTYASRERAPLPRRSLVALPLHDRYVATQQAESPGDFMAILDWAQRITCGVFKVPPVALQTMKSARLRAEYESAEEETSRTAREYADALSQLATRVYSHLFGRYDMIAWFETRVRTRRVRATDTLEALVTEDDVIAYKHTAPQRTLRLVMRPALSLEVAERLRDTGAIDDVEYRAAMRARYDFPQ